MVGFVGFALPTDVFFRVTLLIGLALLSFDFDPIDVALNLLSRGVRGERTGLLIELLVDFTPTT